MSMRSSDSPVNHAKHQQQQRVTRHFIAVVESSRIGQSTMSDDQEGGKKRDDTPEDDGPGEKDVPPPWAAAMARQIVEAVEKVSQAKQRVSQGSLPGTSGKHICTHAHYCWQERPG